MFAWIRLLESKMESFMKTSLSISLSIWLMTSQLFTIHIIEMILWVGSDLLCHRQMPPAGYILQGYQLLPADRGDSRLGAQLRPLGWGTTEREIDFGYSAHVSRGYNGSKCLTMVSVLLRRYISPRTHPSQFVQHPLLAFPQVSTASSIGVGAASAPSTRPNLIPLSAGLRVPSRDLHIVLHTMHKCNQELGKFKLQSLSHSGAIP